MFSPIGRGLIALALLAWSTDGAGMPRRVNTLKLDHAAVCSLAKGLPGSPANSMGLIMTTFSPFGSDSVSVVPDAASFLDGQATSAVVIDAAAVWPNQADLAPQGAIHADQNRSYVLEAGGFFVSPSKSTGEIALLDVTGLSRGTMAAGVDKIKISTDRKGNFYHHAEWHDVNGDGRLDVLAARAYKSMNPFAGAEGDLVWLEQPAEGGAAGVWTERMLTSLKGPGVAFTAVDLDNDGKVEIVAAQFFAAQQLSVWWCDGATWSRCINGTGVSSAVIDSAEKAPYFNVQWVDLDGDGRKDILATTNEANGKGAVFGFEQPHGDFRTEPWTKHKLADGYKPKKAFLPGRGSPGTAVAFQVNMSQPAPAPHILVSADDGGWVDLLIPQSTPWQYEKLRVVNSTDTIGTPAVGDANGDGIADFFVPLFAENTVAAYTFA